MRVKNLPEKPAYENLEQLKAQLEVHLTEVIANEPTVFESHT